MEFVWNLGQNTLWKQTIHLCRLSTDILIDQKERNMLWFQRTVIVSLYWPYLNMRSFCLFCSCLQSFGSISWTPDNKVLYSSFALHVDLPTSICNDATQIVPKFSWTNIGHSKQICWLSVVKSSVKWALHYIKQFTLHLSTHNLYRVHGLSVI